MKSQILTFSIVVLIGLFGSRYANSQEWAESDSAEHFTLRVLPVLDAKCFACHGNDKDDISGELDMTSREHLLAGGESGDPAIVPGQPDESLLVEAIEWAGLEMPPKENDRLSDEQIADVRRWIKNGAIWPDVETQEKIRELAAAAEVPEGQTRIATSGGTSADWTNRTYRSEDVWAFQPLKMPESPNGKSYSIDAFVDRKLAEQNIKPAPRADAATLIRRATFDLTGLPPTPEAIKKFEKECQADADKAWSGLVDDLLASPRYGERWAQHWLDVVRYADTSGFSNDYERSNAWRYRDYVIRSFNLDKPFNQFVIEQIAGDELFADQQAAGVRENEQEIRQSEGIVATGFLRMGQWEHTPMTPNKVSRQNYLDDTVNGIGETFLSTSLRCCKCHDHKFDPIPTKDYYRVYAAMATTQPAEMKAEFLPEENQSQFETQRKHVEQLLTFAKDRMQELYDKREAAAKQWYIDRDREDDYLPYDKRLKVKEEKPRRFVGLTVAEEGELKVREQDERIWTRRLERFEPLAQSVYNGGEFVMHSRKLRKPENGPGAKSLDELPTSFVYAGGSVFSPTDKVTPGILSAVGIPADSANSDDRFALPETKDNRRLGLARWIASPKNGLATRSIVNRVWHYHFGKGIAGNPNNFGGTGAKPTHPELLDWLTLKFVKNNWSIKHLHRLIMNSETYLRSTDHPKAAELNNVDPTNASLAVFRPRRLTAEEIRDCILSATGELNFEPGGLPVRPEINREVALSPRMIQFSIAPAYQSERTPEQRNRRSIYAYRVRGLRDPMMVVLDKASPNESCELRDSASTTPQVFTLLNSESVTNRSIAMASRLQQDSTTVESQIDLAFELLTGQKPNADLRDGLADHYRKMVTYHKDNPPERTENSNFITRSLVEELSGEPFEYQEWLNAFEEYTPDKQPADVSPETRALADVCLLIFNSNQFMYVY